MKQNVTAEKYPVPPVQKTYVIHRLSGRVHHFQIQTTKIQPFAVR